MPQAAVIDGIEWVHESPEPPMDPKLPNAAKVLFVLLCLGLLVLGAVTMRSHERVAAPLPEPTPVPTPTLDLDSFTDPGVQERFRATLATLPDFSIVLPQFGGGPTVRVQTGTDPRVDSSAFVDVHSLTVDSSGRWIAGLSGRADQRAATLWVGPAAGELVPLADGVGGYAWHETAPNQIAFSTNNAVVTHDLVVGSTPQHAIETAHHLERWGAWGFVVRPEAAGTGFHVLASDGAEVATGYRGAVVGSLNQRLIVNLTGGRQSPVFVFADTGQAWPVFALTDIQRAQSVAAGGIDGAVALQVSNRDTETYEIRIFPGNGEVARTLPIAEQTGALTWGRDGTTLYYLSEGAAGSAELFGYDMTTGSLVASPIGTSPSINYWDSAIALAAPRPDSAGP